MVPLKNGRGTQFLHWILLFVKGTSCILYFASAQQSIATNCVPISWTSWRRYMNTTSFILILFFFFLLLSLLCLLSLFLLLQFPHLVYGAVASSAPVKAKLDFSAYSNVNWHWAVDSIFYYYWYQTFPSANLAPNNSLASFHLNLRITQKNIFHCYWSLLETVTSV